VGRTSNFFKPLNGRFRTSFDRIVGHRLARSRFGGANSLTSFARKSRNWEAAAGPRKNEGEADARVEIHREGRYLCASCTFGQALFVRVVGDDGFRPAVNQRK
jgi:hypothetical protein